MSDTIGAGHPVRGIDAGPRLDRLPPAPFHRRVLMLIGTGMFLDACDIYLAPGVLGALVKSGWSDIQTNAWFQFITFGGMLIGALLSGFVGDRFGRRFSYQINLLIFGVASLLAAAAPSMSALIVLRFFMGIGLGAEIVVGYSSLTEFVPPTVRGRYVTILSAITNFSVAAVGFAGAWIIPTFGWRYMFGIVGVAAGVVWYLRKAMPESPRWLESRGRFDEAEAVLRKIESEVGAGRPLPPVQPAPKPSPARFGDLFGRALRKRLLLGAIIYIAGSLSLYGFLSWVPTFLVKQGLALTTSLWVAAFMGLGAPLGALLGAAVADRYGRRRTIITFTLLEVLVGAAYPFVGSGTEVTAVGFSLTLCAYALVAITNLYIPEMFPTPLRLRGAALVGASGRIAAASVQFAVAAVFAAFGVVGVATGLVCVLLVQVLAVWLVGPETSRRSLEDIAADTEAQTEGKRAGGWAADAASATE